MVKLNKIKIIILFSLLVIIITSCSNKKLTPKVTVVKNDTIAESTNQNSYDITKGNSTVIKTTRLLNINKSKLKKEVIVIDPGHSSKPNLQTEVIAPGSSVMKIKDGGGAEGIITKTPEYLVNMRVALKLRNLLQQRGYTIIMTKTDNSLSLGNIDRAEIGNKANADLVIRIHADSNNNTSVKGASMLVPKLIKSNNKAIYSESLRCGKTILDTLVNEVGMVNRGISIHDDMTGFNWSKVPVILVELGFLSNPTEDMLLSDDDYESKLAKGLADGISNSVK